MDTRNFLNDVDIFQFVDLGNYASSGATRNTPANVKFVAQKIAEAKGLSLEEVEKMTFQNTKRILF